MISYIDLLLEGFEFMDNIEEEVMTYFINETSEIIYCINTDKCYICMGWDYSLQIHISSKNDLILLLDSFTYYEG